MLNDLFSGAKKMADEITIKKTKETLIKTSEENGIEARIFLTPAVEEKFDDLVRTILKEHGYIKLSKMMLIARCG